MNNISNINNQKTIESSYNSIRQSIVIAYNKVYTAVNIAMVGAYWEIGEQIYKACGNNLTGPSMVRNFLILSQNT